MSMDRRALLSGGVLTGLAVFAGSACKGQAAASGPAPAPTFKLTDAEWRKRLSPEAYRVLRQEGTERAGSSPLDAEGRKGTYSCAGCDLPLFKSNTKFHSGTGWPSFWAPIPGAVNEIRDSTLGMVRTAVACRRCAGHLGHVFDDGPPPTGLRYCMNGVALTFHPA